MITLAIKNNQKLLLAFFLLLAAPLTAGVGFSKVSSEFSNPFASHLFENIDFTNVDALLQNRYFKEADKVVDTDPKRAAHWLISILHENRVNPEISPEDFKESPLCLDACRALMHVHSKNINDAEDKKDAMHYKAYKALTADVAALVAPADSKDVAYFAEEARLYYGMAYATAQRNWIGYGTSEWAQTLSSYSPKSDAPVTRAFVLKRFNDLARHFSSSLSYIETIHENNIKELASLEDE